MNTTQVSSRERANVICETASFCATSLSKHRPSNITLASSLILRSSQRIFEEKIDCSHCTLSMIQDHVQLHLGAYPAKLHHDRNGLGSLNWSLTGFFQRNTVNLFCLVCMLVCFLRGFTRGLKQY